MAEEDPTYYTRLDPEAAEEVERYRERNDLSKSEAVSAIVDDWVASKENGPFERAFFVGGILSALVTVWFFFVSVVATVAVMLADAIQVPPVVVGGLFGMFSAAAFLTMTITFVSQRYGLAAMLDRKTVEDHQYIDP